MPHRIAHISLVSVVALLGLFSSATAGPRSAHALTIDQSRQTFVVDPINGTQTGLNVNSGDSLSFQAAGNWCIGSPPVDAGYECGGPDGIRQPHPGEPSPVFPGAP